MGGGSVAKKAAGFDGLFGSGFRRGGRIGFQDGGGLSGLGMDPAITPLLQLSPFDPTKGVTPLQIGSSIPKPPTPSSQQSSSSSPDFKGLGSSLNKIASAFMPQQNGIDSFSGSDLADISSGGPDFRAPPTTLSTSALAGSYDAVSKTAALATETAVVPAALAL